MAVDRFVSGIRQSARCRVAGVEPQARAAGLEGGEHEVVLEIEIGGAGENSARTEKIEGVFEQAVPNLRGVPVVLVADEDEVRSGQFPHPVGGRGVSSAEGNVTAGQRPAGARLGDRVRPEVDAEVEADPRRSEGAGNRPGFVGTTAGEVDDHEETGWLEIGSRKTFAQERGEATDVRVRAGEAERLALNHAQGSRAPLRGFQELHVGLYGIITR